MKKTKSILLPLLSVVLVCFYPCAFMYFRNAGEARAAHMLPFFGIFLLSALIMLLVAGAVLRNLSRAAFLADLGAILIINFTMVCGGIKSLIPGFRNMILLAAAGILLLLLLILFLRKKPDMTVPCGLIALAVGVMTVVGAIPAIPAIVSAATYRAEEAPDPTVAEQTFTEEKRNFYFLVFDEFGGPVNLEHYYGDPQAAFWDALRDRGFQVSETTKNTESAWTVTLLPNLLWMDYVADDSMEPLSRMEWMKAPNIYRLFRNNGYDIHVINQDSFLDEAGCKVLTHRQNWETISVYLYENSIFCQIPKLKWVIEDKVLHRGPDSYRVALQDVRDALVSCGEAEKQGPTLTVGYVCAPHAPFLYEPDGSPTRPGEYYDWRRPELYLAKLEFAKAAILEAVDNIQQADPEAVIVLQGDHGSREPGQKVYYFGGPWFDADAEIPFMENAMCCVYVPGGAPDIEGLSCINATRTTIDAVYGTSLGTIPQPPDYTIPKEYMPPEEG